MAAEERAEPSALGMGPMTGEEGPVDGVATGLDNSGGAVLHAATSAAAAPDTMATSQKRRGAAVSDTCFMVLVM